MGTLVTFPGAATPAELSAASEAALKAMDLLQAVRGYLPRDPGDCDAVHELEVFGEAVRILQRGRALEETPDAVVIALVDEAIVLADLCGQALAGLDDRRQARAIPLALGALADALNCPVQPPPEPTVA